MDAVRRQAAPLARYGAPVHSDAFASADAALPTLHQRRECNVALKAAAIAMRAVARPADAANRKTAEE